MTELWRQPTREEIRAYYHEEYPEQARTSPLAGRLTHDGPDEYGVKFRDRYPVAADDRPPTPFIRRSTAGLDGVWDSFDDVLAFFQAPARNDPLQAKRDDNRLVDPDVTDHPAPTQDAVYFTTTHSTQSWLLFIDIDAKDIALERAKEAATGTATRTDTELKERAGIVEAEPTGFEYAFQDIDRALELGFQTADILEQYLNMDDVVVQYSGQGCHIFGADNDSSHRYDTQSRKVIVTFLTERFDLPIDTKVTADDRRHTRVPYSLHGGVGRVVTPITSPDFDYRKQALPDVIGGAQTEPETQSD